MSLFFRYPFTFLLLFQNLGFVVLNRLQRSNFLTEDHIFWMIACFLFGLHFLYFDLQIRKKSKQEDQDQVNENGAKQAIFLISLVVIWQAWSGSLQEEAWVNDWTKQAETKIGVFDVQLRQLFRKKDHWVLIFDEHEHSEIDTKTKTETIMTKIDQLPENVAIGSDYWLVGDFKKFKRPLQATDWDEMAYAQRNRYHWKGQIKGLYLKNPSVYHDLYRGYLAFFLKARSYFELKGEAGALLNGLIFGDLSVSLETRQAFNATGISHLLSVSGFHVSLLAYLLILFFDGLFVLCGFVFPRKWSILATLFAIWLFIAMAQFSTCAQRSGYMTSLMLIFSHSRIKLPAIESCSISAHLLFDPMSQLEDISLQLSYSAVYALLLFANFEGLKRFSFVIQICLSSLLVSFVAMMGTIALQAYHFGTCSPFSVIFNCLLTPIGGVILMPLGIIALFIAPYSSSLVDFVCVLTDIWRDWTIFGASLVGGEFFVPRSSAWLFGIVSICFFSILTWFKFLKSKEDRLILLCITSALVVICLSAWQNEKADQIQNQSISWLSVGQGNATVIAGDLGFAMIDVGPKANQFQLISALKLNGIQKIDWLLISHLHPDHYGGLWGLLDENIEIAEIQFHGHMLGGGEWGALVEKIKSKGIPLKTIKKGRFEWDGLVFEDLWDLSTLGFSIDQALENDLSVPRMLILNQGAILLSGDLETQGEARLIVALMDFEKRWPNFPILAFQVNHHGSRTSSHPMLISFFERHQARAVISLGLNHKFAFPHPQTVYRLRNLEIFRTDLGRIDLKFKKH